MIRLKKRYVILLALLALFLAAGAVFGPGLVRGAQVYRLAEEFLLQESGSADLSVEGAVTLSGRLDWVTEDAKRIFRFEQSPVAVYFCDGVVYLENGKGYDFSEGMPDLTQVLERPWLLYFVTRVEKDGGTWTVTVKGEDLVRWTDVPEGLSLELTLQEGKTGAQSLGISLRSGETALDGVLTAREIEPMTVPQAVLDAIASGQVQAGQDLTKQTLRLMGGWADLGSRETLAMAVRLSADLGMVTLDDTLELYRTNVGGTAISYLERNGTGVYFSDRGMCSAGGRILTEQETDLEAAQLLGLAYYLCMNAELECRENVFRLALDQQGMEAVVYAIVPEAADMNIDFQSGDLEMVMDGEKISSIRLRCGGSVDVLLAQIEVSVGAEAEIMDENVNFTVPQAVIDALT